MKEDIRLAMKILTFPILFLLSLLLLCFVPITTFIAIILLPLTLTVGAFDSMDIEEAIIPIIEFALFPIVIIKMLLEQNSYE